MLLTAIGKKGSVAKKVLRKFKTLGGSEITFNPGLNTTTITRGSTLTTEVLMALKEKGFK